MNAETKTEEVTNRLEGWQKKIGETAQKVGSATDEYIHENAWTSIAFAAVLGCVVGFLIGSRRE